MVDDGSVSSPGRVPHVDTFWLEAFLVVAEELHFGRAAERLHVGQSPLSQTIRRLERRVGAALFNRSTRTVSLTGAGESLIPWARSVLEDVRLGVQAVDSAEGTVRGAVRATFSGAVNHATVPALVRAVRMNHPGVNLSFTDRMLSGEAVTALEQRRIDIAFTGVPVPSGELESMVIQEDPQYLLVPEDHPMADGSRVSFGDLNGEQFVSMPVGLGSTMRGGLDRAADRAGFAPTVVQEVFDPYMLMSLVAAGLGVTVVPSSLVQVRPLGTVAVDLDGVEPLRSAIAWHRADRSPAVAAVVDDARGIFK